MFDLSGAGVRYAPRIAPMVASIKLPDMQASRGFIGVKFGIAVIDRSTD
jgi:hypothetical protein